MPPPLTHLPPPARYFPMAGGRYEIKPGLFRFGKSFGNGEADARVFQFDRELARYRQTRLAARRQRLGKYFQVSQLSEDVARAAGEFMVARLASEWGDWFVMEGIGPRRRLICRLTGEVLEFDEQMRLVGGEFGVEPPYQCALDALASQTQEDIAIISAQAGRHWVSALHLCFPNHWSAEEKIGGTFVDIHRPVAGIEPVNARADELVRVMMEAREGLVRFAWGIATDDQLNHHPRPEPGEEPGRAFDPKSPRAFLRIERQTIWGLAEVEAAIFTIRTYLLDCATLSAAERADVIAAVESMTRESLRYKGLAESKGPLTEYLKSG
jgi:hypothetical protein